jgi:hypothetical protein
MIHDREKKGSRESNLKANKHVCLQFVVVAAYTHFRIPAAKPASAGDHSPPSTACSSLTISCSQSGAAKPLFSASLGTCIIKHHSLSAQNHHKPQNHHPSIKQLTTKVFKRPN